MQGAITLAIAVLGAVLGVLNWWRNFNTDRVRLRVVPIAFRFGEVGDVVLAVQVVNLSTFAVTLDEIGFTLDRQTRTTERDHIQLFPCVLVEGGSLPKRLIPRAVATVNTTVTAENKAKLLAGTERLYAETACGVRGFAVPDRLRKALDDLALARPQVIAHPVADAGGDD
jgi:hypothetical protein